jgi:long-chain fatty acid transport protein
MQRFGKCAWLLIVGFPALLSAQGFGIYEQNTCTMARGGTAAAAPCPDGSAIFFNPAGLAGLKGGHASIGVTLIDVMGGFTDDIFGQNTKLDDPLLPVPQAYVSYAVTPKVGVGLGLFAPYGLETKWPLAFDGRFAGYDNIIKTFYVQPTVAYQVTPWLKLGGGFDIVHGSVALHQRLDLSQTPLPPGLPVPPGTTFGQFGIPLGTDFADVDLEASKTSFSGHFGAIAKVNDRLSIGAHYLMKVTLNYAGTAHFTPVATGIVIPADITVGSLTIPAGTQLDAFLTSLGLFTNPALLADQTATASIANPDMLVVGVAYKATEQLTLLADYQWTHWSTFSVLNLTFAPNTLLNQTLTESYKSTSGVRVGGEWATNAGMIFRGGYLYHQGAAPAQTVTPLLPEGERNEFTAGFSMKMGRQLTANLAYQYIRQNDRRGRTRETPNLVPTVALNNGLYTFSAHLVGVSLAFTF